MANEFKNISNVIYTEKLNQINKGYLMLLDNASKVIFLIIFYASGIKHSTMLQNKENKRQK